MFVTVFRVLPRKWWSSQKIGFRKLEKKKDRIKINQKIQVYLKTNISRMIRASVNRASFLERRDFIKERQIHRPTTIWFLNKLWYYIDTVLQDSTHEDKQSFWGVHRVSMSVQHRQMFVYLPIKDMALFLYSKQEIFFPFFIFCPI